MYNESGRETQVNIVDKLRAASAYERPGIIENIYLKNRQYFSEHHPHIYAWLEQCECPYHIDITDDFLNIVHSPTGALCHPESGLDSLAEALADPSGIAWKELMCLGNDIPSERFRHGKLLWSLYEQLLRYSPDFGKRTASLTKPAPASCNSSVIFIGVFHGLHISAFLHHNDAARIMLLEPEPERFMVSCYFLDYSELHERFGELMLGLGISGLDGLFRKFFAWQNVTAQVWTRILLGYTSPSIPQLVEHLSSVQKCHLNHVRPFDLDIEGIKNTFRNLESGVPALSGYPELSAGSRIMVVGSGPSLENDLEWIRANQNMFIIFAVHSAVKILVKNGIIPDFQFAIDIHLNGTVIKRLGMLRDRPLIGTSKINLEWFNHVNNVWMVESDIRAGGVKFFKYVRHIYPTTGNLAIGMACFCKPAMILLAGLDFGFKSNDKRHANGGFYNNRKKQNLAGTFEISANFSSSKPVHTTTYFNMAIASAQAALSELSSVKVYNLSDGASIKGAVPFHSSQLELEEYIEKQRDIRRINDVFQPARSGYNWEEYSVTGSDLIEQFKSMIKEYLEMEIFEMNDFTQRLDNMFVNVIAHFKEEDGGSRVEVYLKFVLDVVVMFYRFILMEGDERARAKFYYAALPEVFKIVDKIDWPDSQSVK